MPQSIDEAYKDEDQPNINEFQFAEIRSNRIKEKEYMSKNSSELIFSKLIG